MSGAPLRHRSPGPSRSRLRAWGPTGAAMLVAVLVGMIAFIFIRIFSGILIPGAASLIIAILVLPFTDRLAARMPRSAAVAIVLVMVAVFAIAMVVMFARGLLDQAPAIQAALTSAAAKFEEALGGSIGATGKAAIESLREAVQSADLLVGWVAGAIGSIVPVLMGLFIAAMVLFLVLLDPSEAKGWFARITSWPPAQSNRFLTTAGQVFRDYYKGATVIALVNAVPVYVVAKILGTSGAAAVFVVMFLTSYIPYVGAWLGGVFAVLMALGSGGTTDALIMVGAVVFVNLALQGIVQPFAYSATMRVSALGVFLATLLGGAVAGVFGAMLAAPLVAMITRYRTDVLADPPPEAAETG